MKQIDNRYITIRIDDACHFSCIQTQKRIMFTNIENKIDDYIWDELENDTWSFIEGVIK